MVPEQGSGPASEWAARIDGRSRSARRRKPAPGAESPDRAVTTKRQDRLAALDGQQAADEGLTLNQNADDVVSVEIVRQG